MGKDQGVARAMAWLLVQLGLYQQLRALYFDLVKAVSYSSQVIAAYDLTAQPRAKGVDRNDGDE